MQIGAQGIENMLVTFIICDYGLGKQYGENVLLELITKHNLMFGNLKLTSSPSCGWMNNIITFFCKWMKMHITFLFIDENP
jgi:hypothetical protein